MLIELEQVFVNFLNFESKFDIPAAHFLNFSIPLRLLLDFNGLQFEVLGFDHECLLHFAPFGVEGFELCS